MTRSFAIVALIATTAGCSTLKDLKTRAKSVTQEFVAKSYDDPQAEAKFADAQGAMNNKDYSSAKRSFHALAGNSLNPVMLTEKARFLEAECYRLNGDYPDAVDVYHKMLQEHPTGAYREQACQRMFEIADYWLDDTREEIQSTEAGQNRFLHKMRKFMSYDHTKPTLDREGRALQTLEHVHLNDVTGPTADKALFWCGFVNFYRGNFVEADHYFSMLVEFHKDSPLRAKATELAIISKNNATGGAVYDGTKAAEALQLVHHAEATMPEFNQQERGEFLTRQKLAIRTQQAEKDFKTAEFYEQTKHPGAAFFCYEIVRRRYPGTKYAEVAAERMAVLRDKAEAEAGKPKRVGPIETVRNAIDNMTGRSTPTPQPSEVPLPAAASGPQDPQLLNNDVRQRRQP